MRTYIQVDKYEDGTVSYFVTALDDVDADTIEELLVEKYSSTGYSCRGPIAGVISELTELLEEVPGWA